MLIYNRSIRSPYVSLGNYMLGRHEHTLTRTLTSAEVEEVLEEGAPMELMLKSDAGLTYVVCDLHPQQFAAEGGIYGGADTRSGQLLRIYVGNDGEPTIVYLEPTKKNV
jgi:hypothetical protein